MPKFSRHTLIALITLLTSSVAGAQTPARTCESLLSLVLPNASITGATVVPAGGFTQPGGRGGNGPRNDEPFCRVSATLKPTSDSDIKIEVWMPQSGWNQKFHAAGGASGGNSAVGGSINYGPMLTALERGYATAGTDLGHDGATFSYAPGHPEKVTDFGYRATHEMTVAAKALMSGFYGSGPRYSYWNACAAGGRQGWHEVQRYPGDYDGLIVIDPANSWTRLQTWSMYVWQVAHATPESYIPPAKYPVIHQAAINRCDASDGATDGLISDPMRCQFDPAVLQCTAADGPNCLTAAQVDTARTIYAPARNPRTNEVIFPGLLPGSELGWGSLAGPNPPYYATETYKHLVFNDPSWSAATRPISLDTDFTRLQQQWGSALDADSPNLKPFFDRGGKILATGGWTDPLIAPGNEVNLFNRVRETVGAAQTDNSYRLFMKPGINHCGGGEGADTGDLLTVLENWVEHGTAPTRLTATRSANGAVQFTRPLCPYPQVAVYSGQGNQNDAASFVCK